jgi:acetolactate synthase-1/2/3 large subunit
MRDKPEVETRRIARADAKMIGIGVSDLFIKAGPQTFQRFQDLDLSVAADGESSLPLLIESVRRRLPSDRSAYEERGRRLTEMKQRSLSRFWTDAGYAWNASPVSTARLSAELWEQIKDKDWSLVHTPRGFTSFWDKRLPHHDLGRSGGSGVGYAAPASAGAALANKKYGRLSVAIQPDGDLMYSPGVLWTAAHHNIPILYVMHNNRAYHQEVMHLQRMACEHNRGIDRATIGTTMDNPFIDFAGLAKSLGVYSQGPITNPADVGPAIRRAIEVVERGEPALLDVVCQPR